MSPKLTEFSDASLQLTDRSFNDWGGDPFASGERSDPSTNQGGTERSGQCAAAEFIKINRVRTLDFDLPNSLDARIAFGHVDNHYALLVRMEDQRLAPGVKNLRVVLETWDAGGTVNKILVEPEENQMVRICNAPASKNCGKKPEIQGAIGQWWRGLHDHYFIELAVAKETIEHGLQIWIERYAHRPSPDSDPEARYSSAEIALDGYFPKRMIAAMPFAKENGISAWYETGQEGTEELVIPPPKGRGPPLWQPIDQLLTVPLLMFASCSSDEPICAAIDERSGALVRSVRHQCASVGESGCADGDPVNRFIVDYHPRLDPSWEAWYVTAVLVLTAVIGGISWWFADKIAAHNHRFGRLQNFRSRFSHDAANISNYLPIELASVRDQLSELATHAVSSTDLKSTRDLQTDHIDDLVTRVGHAVDDVRYLPVLLNLADPGASTIAEQVRQRTYRAKSTRTFDLHAFIEDRLDWLARDRGRKREEIFDLELGHDPVQLRGEPMYLRIVVENLIRNALEHRQKDSRVAVSLRCERHGKGAVARLDVFNRGRPIPKHYLRRIFVQGFSTNKPGTIGGSRGYGLHFVKKVVLGLGGRVYAENYNGGVQFTVELPVAQEPAVSAD